MPMPSEKGAGEDMAVKRASAFSMATRANGKNKTGYFSWSLFGSVCIEWPAPELRAT